MQSDGKFGSRTKIMQTNVYFGILPNLPKIKVAISWLLEILFIARVDNKGDLHLYWRFAAIALFVVETRLFG